MLRRQTNILIGLQIEAMLINNYIRNNLPMNLTQQEPKAPMFFMLISKTSEILTNISNCTCS